MSASVFVDLGLPHPDVNLGAGSGSNADQTARVITRLEPVLCEQRPDWVVVVGDVNSTLAAALVASKLHIPIAHVEAGLRSFDRSMPEEINRLLTDQMSDLLFTHSREADENLLREGVDAEKIHFVGNVMIDTLVRLLPAATRRWPALRERFGLDERFVLATLHRPENVDDADALSELLDALGDVSEELPVVFPVHPRTRQHLDGRVSAPNGALHLVEPIGYLDFLALQANATLVLTDSGGVQEETTFLKIPCLTVRSSTDRPVTLTHGGNRLVVARRHELVAAVGQALADPARAGAHTTPELWDGHAAERIIDVFRSL
jgi:UDP-N-acetylglucosamine 2-epimerase (non-hydrolysing)